MIAVKNFADNPAGRLVLLLSPLPGVEDPVLHQRWSSGPTERVWEEDHGEGPSKRVLVAKGPQLGTESSPQQELLEEVAEAN